MVGVADAVEMVENEVVAVVEEVGEVGEVAVKLLEINEESVRVMNKFPTTRKNIRFRPMKGDN